MSDWDKEIYDGFMTADEMPVVGEYRAGEEQPMSQPLDLDAIRHRAEAVADCVACGGTGTVYKNFREYGDRPEDCQFCFDPAALTQARLIAREDVPALIAEVERLRAENDALNRAYGDARIRLGY